MHNNIMAAGSKERPPMLGPGRYSQWHSRFLRYLDTKSNGEYLRKCIFDGPYLPTNVLIAAVEAAENILPVAAHEEVETIHNMTAENKLYFQAEKEAIFLILTGIGDEIYSTVDACNTAKEMWTAIERLQQGESLNVQDVKTNLFWEFGKFTSRDGESMESYYSRFYKLMNELTRNNLQVSPMQVNVQFLQQLQPEWSRFVTIVKQRQEIDTVSYHKLFDVLKQFQNEVNDIRSERLARSANPLALLAAAQPYSDNYYQAPKPQRSNAPSYMQSSSTRPSASTRHKGKEIAKPVTPQSESVSEEDSDPEQARRDKDMQKNLALLAKYFKKLYKPTNNNLRTSSNSRNKTEDTTPRYNKDNQSGQFGNQRTMTVAGARETVGSPVVQQNGIQCFNCKGFGHYARECRKPKRVKDYAGCEGVGRRVKSRERELLTQPQQQSHPLKIQQNLSHFIIHNYSFIMSTLVNTSSTEISVVKQKYDELVKKSLLTRSQFEGQLKEKSKVISDLKVKEGKDIDTMIEMDKQIKFLNEILYKRNQSIQTIHMLAPKCATYHGRSTFANPKYLKKAQSDKPRLYEIPYDTSDPANRFCPDGEETVTLEKESRSKLDKDKVKPYNYTYQNSLYETFKPPSKAYLDQLERAKEVRKTMWRKTFVRTKPNIAKNVGFLPMSKSISKSRLLYNEMTNNFNHFRTICQQTWSNHTSSAFPNPTAKSMEVLIKILLMPLSDKTILDRTSIVFVHRTKKVNECDDLGVTLTPRQGADELEFRKGQIFQTNMIYFTKSQRCECLAQKLSKQTESVNTESLTDFDSATQIRKQAVRKTNVIAPGPSRNFPKHVSLQSPREKVGSNDMVHNYYLEKAKKSAQLQKDKEVNGKPSMINPARLPNTANGCKPKPRNWQASMSSRVSNKDVHLGEHRKQKPFLKFQDLQVLH
ncbi:retrovirus-related pol polyprotein from transposon TNT 1-94 [Tanacetum coccineum]